MSEPTMSKTCETCGKGTVKRYRGQGDVTCPECGQAYNACGQRLRSDYAANPSMWDDEIGDMEGYEMAHADDY